MDKTLHAAVSAGGLILTVNDRLARTLLQQYDAEQRQQGLAVWLRPEILSLSVWLNRCQMLMPGMPFILSKAQQQHVWELIIEADVEHIGNGLLQIPQTANRALQAHQLLIDHAAEFSIHEAAEDHRAFLRWRKAWQALADAKGWQDPAELCWLLARDIAAGRVPLPGAVILAGFDETTPGLGNLCKVMEQRGVTVTYWQPQPFENVRRQQVAADDPADEVSRCARWARALLAVNSDASIGVVVPQLEAYRSLIEQVFFAELEPDALLRGEETQNLFNFSLGRGLDREGVIHAALRLLRLGMQIEHEDLSWLLRTPYLGKAASEGDARAQLDRELRRLRRYLWSVPRLTGTINNLPNKYASAVPGFVRLLGAMTKALRMPGKHLPGSWAEHFTAYLDKLGWPGERGLSSREYQAVSHFREMMGHLASLDGVSAPIDRATTIKILTRMISNEKFQPEGTDSPVQVLGELESSGMTFDHLWVLGLHDAALPGSPSPNPFIPMPVQRRHRMKRVDSEREQSFASQVVERLFSAAPDVVLSWPVHSQGAEQRPSSFLRGIPGGEPLMADSCDPTQVIWRAAPLLESITDSQGPALSTRKPFSGGTGIIKDQALCPFRAFAHHRLRAERLDVSDIGIDNMSRGTLAHTALELFWSEVVDRDSLLSLDEAVFDKLLNRAVDGALGRLERERLCDLPARQRYIEGRRLNGLLRQWLEFERQRSPFRVTTSEQSCQVKIGKLVIRTRIDRIDELDDGTCAIIDYKTGRPDPLQWLEERVTEPQLPTYSLHLPHGQLGAVMFAIVRSKEKESGFRGLARKLDAWPGAKSRALDARLDEKGWSSFDDVLAHWGTSLPALGDAFAKGDALVDPVDPKLACQYCDLTGFCRILERGNLPLEGNDD